MYKKLQVFSLSILLVIAANTALAQYRGMGAVNRALSTQSMNQMGGMMQMNMLRGGYGNSLYSANYDFVVMLKDSSKKEFKSQIHTDTILHKSYLIYTNKKLPKKDPNREQRIYPDQTIGVIRDITINDVANLGTPTDSCWLFRAIQGPVSVYSYLSETDDNFNPESVVGIQLEQGPIVQFNINNLKQMIGKDANAIKFIEKKNYMKAIAVYNKNIEKMERRSEK